MRGAPRRAAATIAAATLALAASIAGASLAGAATSGAPSRGSVCVVTSCPYHGPTTSVTFSSASGKVLTHDASQGTGYWLVASDGGIFNYGTAAFDGSTGGTHLNEPIVGMTSTPDGGGYWLVASDGGIFNYGDASFYGSTGGTPLNRPIVGMASTPSGHGYWLVASDGGIFSYGDASFYGSTGGTHLNEPIVGMASTPDGKGYWLVASDGGIFSYGDASFYGSTGGTPLNEPIVGMASTPDGKGYWLVASDGGIFSYGEASFYGSTGGTHLNEPIVGMASTPDGVGYWLVASDGGIFSYGDASFYGSTGGTPLNKPIVGMAPLPASSVATSPGSPPLIPPTASLTVDVSELPIGTNADVSVSGPDGFSETLAASTTISPATPGAWSMVAEPVNSDGDTYYPLTQTQDITLDSGATGTVSFDYADAVADTDVVATPDALESLSGPDDSGFYTATVSDPGEVIQVGSVLTVAAGSNDPNGLLLDVTAVTNTDGADSITGTQGSLTDIGPQADIDVDTGTLASAEVPHAEGAHVTQVAHADEDSLSDPLSCSGSVSGTVSGSVSFSPSVHFSAKWGGILNPTTFTASASMSGTEQATLDAEVDAAASCTYQQDIPPTPIVLAVIDVQVGPVPLILTPELDFELEATGTVEAKMEASATQTLTATAGVSWNGSSLSPIASLSNRFSSQAPTVSLDGTLHAQVGPQLSLLLYGVAGPYIDADAFATFTASLTSTPWWTLTGGFEAGGGIELDIFGDTFSKGDPSILSKTWTIAEATTPAPLTVTTQSLEDGTQGDTYDQSLAAEGGTSPYSWAVTSGSLPDGLTLSSSGTITGTPTATGTSDFTVTVTDNNGTRATASLSIDVGTSGGGGDLIGVASLTGAGDGYGGYCAVLQTSGGVDCWGYNGDGELGNGTTTSSDVPIAVVGVGGTGTLAGVASVTTDSDGEGSYCAVLTSGSVDCWGYNGDGRLGNGTTTNTDVPTAVVGVGGTGTLSGVTSLTSDGTLDNAGGYCAVLTAGGVDCWGNDTNADVPVAVVGVDGTGSLSGVANLTSDGSDGYCAQLTTSGVDCWGYNGDGQLGNGTTTSSDVPTAVVGVGGTGTLSGVASVTPGDETSYCAVLIAGGVDCWGNNNYGQLGNGTIADSDVPSTVIGTDGTGTLFGVVGLVGDDYGGYCAQLTSGGVDCWGFGEFGELGNGTTNDSDVPTAVVGVGGTGTLSGVSDITFDANGGSGGGYCVVILAAGGVDCWGSPGEGGLGNGTTNDSDVPTAVVGAGGTGTLSGVRSLTSGEDTYGYCAVLIAGGVDCWGDDQFGQLGNGDTAIFSDVPLTVLAAS